MKKESRSGFPFLFAIISKGPGRIEPGGQEKNKSKQIREVKCMKMTNREYAEYVKKKTPNSRLLPNMLKAFPAGGLICCVGQGILDGLMAAGLDQENAAAGTSILLVLTGALLTGAGVYDSIAKFAGAGTLVPITGFANSVVSPALEFKTEGYITGTAAKMFIIAGPVIVFGVASSIVYGIVLVQFKLV